MAEPVHEQIKSSADQTKAAAQRTAQASERTYAAWVRTGLVALARATTDQVEA